MFDILFQRNAEKRKVIGNFGEDVAEEFLRKGGYRILDRNYRNKYGRQLGELDIVAQERDMIVFVEVKTRQCRTSEAVFPEENISFDKLRKLSKIAELWLREKNRVGCSYRFDAVTVLICGRKDPEIRQIRNIFL
jgi:putative endonuclease